MQATTARGTDAERTEEAAPVVAVENVEVEAAARVVLEDKDVALEVICEVARRVLLPAETVAPGLVLGTGTVTSDPDALVAVRAGGTDGSDAVPELGITLGSVSVTPPSLRKKSSENHWNSMVNKKRGTYGGAVPDGVSCGSAMAVAATARRVKS